MSYQIVDILVVGFFFCQAEDGIRDLVRSRGLGDVYKRQIPVYMHNLGEEAIFRPSAWSIFGANEPMGADFRACLLYTSDAADERSSVDLGGRRIIKKKKQARVGAGAASRRK